jgi:predicted phage terminase large subunit-like protein
MPKTTSGPPPILKLEDFSPGGKSMARALPAGFALYASHGKWNVARHLLIIQAYLMAMLDGVFDNLIVSMPPRHGKSMFISQYFPAWYLGTHPNHEIILTSYEAGLAGMFGGRCRDLMVEFGPELWGLGVKSDKRATTDWLLSGRDATGSPVVGGMRAAGVGTGVTGRGANLIIIDDPFKDAKQANSELYRQTVWDWYLSTLFTRREPNAKQVCVMTRWHEDDLVGRFIERSEEQEGVSWVELALPAITEIDDVAGDPLSRDVGESLWPERWSSDDLITIKESMTPYWWGALYQQRPAPAEGNIFKRQWWKFWVPNGHDPKDYPPVRLHGLEQASIVEELPGLEYRAQSWDLAFKKGEGTSYVVGQLWGRSGVNGFLLDQDRARRDFPETLQAVRDMSARYSDVETKWIEDAANAAATVAVLGTELPGIVPVKVEGSKEDRALAVSSLPEAGNIYLPHPAICPWVLGFIEEVSAFPNAKNDDQVDCMTQALRKLFGPQKPNMLWGRRHRR